jgi:hypothetical protein
MHRVLHLLCLFLILVCTWIRCDIVDAATRSREFETTVRLHLGTILTFQFFHNYFDNSEFVLLDVIVLMYFGFSIFIDIAFIRMNTNVIFLNEIPERRNSG